VLYAKKSPWWIMFGRLQVGLNMIAPKYASMVQARIQEATKITRHARSHFIKRFPQWKTFFLSKFYCSRA